MAVSKQDVVHAAIQLERDGMKFYTEAASKASSDLGSKMLASFAKDEQNHIKWIETVSDGAVPDVEPPAEIYNRLRGIFAGADQQAATAAGSVDDDIEAVRFAMGMEKKSVAAYEKWATEADNEDVRNLCTKLAEVEAIHCDLLKNTVEYLEHTGDWFMQEEGWMFDGG